MVCSSSGGCTCHLMTLMLMIRWDSNLSSGFISWRGNVQQLSVCMVIRDLITAISRWAPLALSASSILGAMCVHAHAYWLWKWIHQKTRWEFYLRDVAFTTLLYVWMPAWHSLCVWQVVWAAPPLWICSLAIVQQGCCTVFCWAGAWWEGGSTSICTGWGKGYVKWPCAAGERVQADTQTSSVLQLSQDGTLRRLCSIHSVHWMLWKASWEVVSFSLKKEGQIEKQLKTSIFH